MCLTRLLKLLFLFTGTASFFAASLFSGLSIMCLNKLDISKTDTLHPPAGTIFPAGKSCKFAIISDSGYHESPMFGAIRDAKKKKIDFILNLGDIARRISFAQYERLLTDLHKELGNTPFYSIPGNHDILASGKEGLIRHKPYFQYYNRAFGPSYYWFGFGDTMFVALNTAIHKLDKPQLKWLARTLDSFREDFNKCIIYMHIPPKDPRQGHNEIFGSGRKEFKEILSQHDITAIFAGHLHCFSETTFAEIPLYIAPSSGQKIRSCNPNYGYLYCQLDEMGKLDVECVFLKEKRGRKAFKAFMYESLVSTGSLMLIILLYVFSLFAFGITLLLQNKLNRHYN